MSPAATYLVDTHAVFCGTDKVHATGQILISKKDTADSGAPSSTVASVSSS